MAEPTIITPFRSIQGPSDPDNPASEQISLIADAVVTELHTDELVMTDHPVEQGSVISDHAYMMPKVVELEYGWSASPKSELNPYPVRGDEFIRSLYQQLLEFQSKRVLLNINTGKRNYSSMLIQKLTEETNRDTENALVVRVLCRQVILANAKTFFLADSSTQKQAKDTQAPIKVGVKYGKLFSTTL